MKIEIDLEALLKCQPHCEDSKGFPESLQAVRLEKDKYVSTNGKSLIIHAVKDNGLDKPVNVIFGKNTIQHVKKVIKNINKTGQSNLGILLDTETGNFECLGVIFMLKIVEEPFPDYIHYIPKKEDVGSIMTSQITVNSELLKLFVFDDVLPTLYYNIKSKVLLVGSGGRWFGLMMPMTESELNYTDIESILNLKMEVKKDEQTSCI